MKALAVVIALLLLAAGVYVRYAETGPASRLVEHLNEAIEAGGGVEYLAEPAIDQLVDRLNESGYPATPVDPDEPLLKRRTILISEGMNERVARHVIERLLHLDAVDPAGAIDLRITTSGGWTDAAFAIVDTMRSIRAPVNVTAIGGCYSAGTVVLAAGTGVRAAAPDALLSVHVNDFLRDGDEYDFDRQELKRFREVYRRYTAVPDVWFDTPGDNQYYLDAQQALRLGLIDEIEEPAWKAPAERAASEDRPAA